jgi:hypothetical protein
MVASFAEKSFAWCMEAPYHPPRIVAAGMIRLADIAKWY